MSNDDATVERMPETTVDVEALYAALDSKRKSGPRAEMTCGVSLSSVNPPR
jgi:hypothetical protein